MLYSQAIPTLKQYIYYNRPDSLKQAIKNGLNVNQIIDKDENTLLLLASNRAGCIEIIELLLKRHARTDVRNRYGEFPLWCAARTSAENVKLLLEYGADPNQRYHDGRTPFMKAGFSVMEGILNRSVLDYFLNSDTDMDATDNNGMTLLMYAVKFNDLMMVQYLIQHGADSSALTPSGMSLIELADVFSADSVKKYLLEKKK